MKRAEKIRLANLAAKAAEEESPRDKAEREAARREWGETRKAARDAYFANKDWVGILNSYRDREGFYTPDERARMCKDFTNELVTNTINK